MTRACQCGLYLGEKCSQCGGSNLAVKIFSSGVANEALLFHCRDCDLAFFPGQGGITTGLCGECEERETAKVKGERHANAE